MIVLHYFTDHFDGKLGKYRDTGLRKWGFYMDHLFDYGFLVFDPHRLFIPDSPEVDLQHDAGFVRFQRLHVPYVFDVGGDG